jgi:hypothetical protein
MNWIVSLAYAVVGLALIYWAPPLSSRSSAWTARFRERRPTLYLPPTSEWRTRNAKVTTGVLRILGVFLVLLAILYALPSILSTKTG